jgi:hypothetical protein
MNKFSRKLITGLTLATLLASGQSHADIQTSKIISQGGIAGTDMKTISSTEPCYIKSASVHPENYAKIAQILKDNGIPITDKDNGFCKIIVGGDIGYTDANGKDKNIYLDEFLADPSRLTIVEPNPQVKTEESAASETTKNTHNASNGGVPISGNGIQLLTETGGLVDGFHGAMGSGVAGTVINLFSGIHPEKIQQTPPGEAKISLTTTLGHYMKNTASVFTTYVASTDSVKPEDLIDVGVKRLAVKLKMKIAFAQYVAPSPIRLPWPPSSICSDFIRKIEENYTGAIAFNKQFPHPLMQIEHPYPYGCVCDRTDNAAALDTGPLAGVVSINISQDSPIRHDNWTGGSVVAVTFSTPKARAYIKTLLGLPDPDTLPSATPNDAGKVVADTAQTADNGRAQK